MKFNSTKYKTLYFEPYKKQVKSWELFDWKMTREGNILGL